MFEELFNENEDDYCVDKETAEKEVIRWVKSNKLMVNKPWADKNDKKDVEEDLLKIMTEIRKGRIQIDEEGKLLFTPDGFTEPLVFHEPYTPDLAQIDKEKETAKVGQSRKLLSAVTKTSDATINKLNGRDLLFGGEIASLFLA